MLKAGIKSAMDSSKFNHQHITLGAGSKSVMDSSNINQHFNRDDGRINSGYNNTSINMETQPEMLKNERERTPFDDRKNMRTVLAQMSEYKEKVFHRMQKLISHLDSLSSSPNADDAQTTQYKDANLLLSSFEQIVLFIDTKFSGITDDSNQPENRDVPSQITNASALHNPSIGLENSPTMSDQQYCALPLLNGLEQQPILTENDSVLQDLLESQAQVCYRLDKLVKNSILSASEQRTKEAAQKVLDEGKDLLSLYMANQKDICKLAEFPEDYVKMQEVLLEEFQQFLKFIELRYSNMTDDLHPPVSFEATIPHQDLGIQTKNSPSIPPGQNFELPATTSPADQYVQQPATPMWIYKPWGHSGSILESNGSADPQQFTLNQHILPNYALIPSGSVVQDPHIIGSPITRSWIDAGASAKCPDFNASQVPQIEMSRNQKNFSENVPMSSSGLQKFPPVQQLSINDKVNGPRSRQPIRVQCFICAEIHAVKVCPTFLASTDRKALLRKYKLCFYCMKHIFDFKKPCRSINKVFCDTCKSTSHPTELHPMKPLSSSASKASDSYKKETGASSDVVLPTAMVNVIANNDWIVPIRCLIDCCSQSNYIAEGFVRKLRLPREQTSVIILGVGGVTSKVKSMVNLSIQVDFPTRQILKIKALVVPKVATPLSGRTKNFNFKENGFPLADPSFNKKGHIPMLLGSGILPALFLDGVDHQDGYLLQKTVFGWIVSGGRGTDIGKFTSTHVTLSKVEQSLQKFWDMPVNKEKFSEVKADECEQMFQEKHYPTEATPMHNLNISSRSVSGSKDVLYLCNNSESKI